MPALRWAATFRMIEALLGVNHVRHVIRFHGEGFFFDFFGQRTAFEVAEIAALCGGGPVRTFLGHIFEFGAFTNLGKQVIQPWPERLHHAWLDRSNHSAWLSVETRISLKRTDSGCSSSALCSS